MVGVMLCLLTGCMFTGVESTRAVTEKEVKRTMSELERRQPTMTLRPFRDSVPAWRVGKEFFVTDNQLKLLFVNAADDTVSIANTILLFDGYETGDVLDNRNNLNLRFKSCGGKVFLLRTGKTLDDFTSSYVVPLLIDMDLVRDADQQLRGQKVYITTPLWYDPSDASMRRGRQFVEVRIDSVCPGNKVLPLKVCFTAMDTGERAFVWMSSPGAAMHNRDFDSMFALRDPHENYPGISDEIWRLIVMGDLRIGMTKDECRLAVGAPKNISRLPDQSGLREYWYYDGGSYLFFVDGLLNQYRK